MDFHFDSFSTLRHTEEISGSIRIVLPDITISYMYSPKKQMSCNGKIEIIEEEYKSRET